MTELENDLRAHGEGVAAGDPRYAGAPRASRSRARFLAPLAAAAAVVLIGGGAVAIVAHHSGTSSAGQARGGAVSGAALAGTQWRLVSVRTGTHTVAIPARLRAAVAFARGGAFRAYDSVNNYSGSYRATGNGVVISNVAGTLAGYAGDDPAVQAAAGGMGALTGAVSAVITPPELILRVRDTTLTFTTGDADPDPGFTGAGDAASDSPSPTPPISGQSYVNSSELPASPSAS